MAQARSVSVEEMEKIKEFIETIRFGSVNIIIQDGKIVQIDKSEKIRI